MGSSKRVGASTHPTGLFRLQDSPIANSVWGTLMPQHRITSMGFAVILFWLTICQPLFAAERGEPLLWRRIDVPETLLTTRDGVKFGGDVRIGDLDGDGRCDFLVYRCDHGAPSGAHMGGMKPVFLGAFDIGGRRLWSQGRGGNHPSRPMSVAVDDMDDRPGAEVICFWHRPDPATGADWRSLGDVVVQIRSGRTGEVFRESQPEAITSRRMKDPGGSNWVHQRLLIANFRGTPTPRDLVVKLGDTYVAMDESLEVLWTYQTPWIKYSQCPAYIPAVGDMDGDGRDELSGGYFLLDSNGRPLWEKQLAPNMDSVAIAEWDQGNRRAICSGAGHVLDIKGSVILRLGEELVPHGQEVRVADFRGDFPGPEMAIRFNGHKTDLLVVASANGQVVARLDLNFSPTNVGMEPVYWNGADQPALLYNGGWLWDLKALKGRELPNLPPPGGNAIHRMGFYHAIAADVCGDVREELVLWDPTAASIYIYTPTPLNESAYTRYEATGRQYNPRLMD